MTVENQPGGTLLCSPKTVKGPIIASPVCGNAQYDFASDGDLTASTASGDASPSGLVSDGEQTATPPPAACTPGASEQHARQTLHAAFQGASLVTDASPWIQVPSDLAGDSSENLAWRIKHRLHRQKTVLLADPPLPLVDLAVAPAHFLARPVVPDSGSLDAAPPARALYSPCAHSVSASCPVPEGERRTADDAATEAVEVDERYRRRSATTDTRPSRSNRTSSPRSRTSCSPKRRCMARTWSGGWGGQCAKRCCPGHDFCVAHARDGKGSWRVHGRWGGPIPEAKFKEFVRKQSRLTQSGMRPPPGADVLVQVPDGCLRDLADSPGVQACMFVHTEAPVDGPCELPDVTPKKRRRCTTGMRKLVCGDECEAMHVDITYASRSGGA
mmetsp:Transcript_43329/g.114041  ORF Transcript_43329/g.114041 Transcript_43329/m.114041 type:complete len:386 (-) Transcript_43329:194-1351(-)